MSRARGEAAEMGEELAQQFMSKPHSLSSDSSGADAGNLGVETG
jgi:hypothetical protein